MKQTPLKPGQKSLDRGSTFATERKAQKRRKAPKRDWAGAREKVADERVCRLWRRGDCKGLVEAAHIIGREHDEVLWQRANGERLFWVRPERIVPLCQKHHRAYDSHALDLLGALTPEEEAQAVLDAGGLENARRRLCPSAYRSEPVA